MKKVNKAVIEVKDKLIATLYETDYNYDDELEDYEIDKLEGKYLELIMGCFEVDVSIRDEYDNPMEGDRVIDVEVDRIVIEYDMCELEIKGYKGDDVMKVVIDRNDNYWREIYFKNVKISVVRF
ncbi:MAG: hypothetical protein JHC31_02585 [Sulfurihydrogenibium sp.]|nr:hypothetical protein [Sulfurihydrogenibium sp.]